MKKTLLLTLAAGVAVSATPLMADSDLFITGSTAFRANVHDACLGLFSGTPTRQYDTTKVIGGDGTTANSNPVWTFSGTPIASLAGNISGTLTIHADFTGSIQGAQTVENGVKLLFLKSDGTVMTNTPTIAFSDVSTLSTPYPAAGNYSEESVAVQPFVVCRSVPLTTVSNMSWEQLKYAVAAGRIPFSSWSNKATDHTNFVYMLSRTQDSGTRRTSLAQEGYGFNQSVIVYNYDATNNAFYKATNTLDAATGGSSNNVVSYGVVGAPGNGNANLNWGPGYVGGGDVKKALGYNNAANQALGYLSLADAKAITGVNWSQVVAFDGIWPTAAGPGISGNTGTNDFSPITLGMYPCWAQEVVVYPVVDPSSINSDQNLTAAQLGDQETSGTLLGVLDYQTKYGNDVNPPGGSPITGSIEYEIELGKPAGATAIRLSDMTSFRFSVGGTITP